MSIAHLGLAGDSRTSSESRHTDRVPPHDLLAEQSAIGGMLLIAHFLFIVRGYVLRREFAPDAHFDATASASL